MRRDSNEKTGAMGLGNYASIHFVVKKIWRAVEVPGEAVGLPTLRQVVVSLFAKKFIVVLCSSPPPN